ncbi:MAG: sulfate adenylyltransferase, partial [Candidatus Heimdallarchaeota archaeon]
MIQPHGGSLINKVLPLRERERILGQSDEYKKVQVNSQTIKVIKNIAFGVFSPLEGFMNESNYKYVLEHMYLENNVAWPFPIVLDVSDKKAKSFDVGEHILILDPVGIPIALMDIEDKYDYEKKEFAQKVYGTLDRNHPGVDSVFDMKEKLIGGEIFLVNEPKSVFPELDLKPIETRVLFRELRWDRVVAFQTRNPPHLGHEY